ncbi:MAG: hypothetical protein OEZ06_23825 [Myxococcales bacterium]|nr:hypothetical protein [Myxococcales bacterium]
MRVSSYKLAPLLAWALTLSTGACSDSVHTVGILSAEAKAATAAQGGTSGTRSDGPPTTTGGATAGALASGDGTGGTSGSASDSSSSGGSGAISSDGTGGGSALLPERCTFDAEPAQPKRLDLYLLIDSGIPAAFINSWPTITEGVSQYVDDPRAAGTGVGVRYFGDSCDPGLYAMPQIPVDELPGNAAAIKASIAPVPVQLSPIFQALEGGIDFARSWANSNPHYHPAVVLITDGLSTELFCGTLVDAQFTVARAGFRGTPSITTYVIAVGLGDWPSLLNVTASEGGSDRARTLDLGDPPSALAEHLVEIQRDADPCIYAVPEAAAERPTQIALAVNDTGPARALQRVADRPSCSAGAGFYLDDLSAPAWLTACPVSCNTIKNTERTPWLLTGCEAETR